MKIIHFIIFLKFSKISNKFSYNDNYRKNSRIKCLIYADIKIENIYSIKY